MTRVRRLRSQFASQLVAARRAFYRTALSALPASLGTRLHYWRLFDRLPNLANPTRFSERIQQRKLRDSDPRYATYSDKLAVKSIVQTLIGEQYVTPTLWSGTELPASPRPQWPARFVVKSNHGSGHNAFVDTTKDYDWNSLRRIAAHWLSSRWLPMLNERWYNEITPRLIVEPDLSSDGIAPIDYKFFVFRGMAHLIQVDVDRFNNHKRSLLNTEWNRLVVSLHYPIYEGPIRRPAHLEEMIYIAEKLGREFSFVRVDLYDLDDGPRFGEMTFSPGAGFERFFPDSFDAELGAIWRSTDTKLSDIWLAHQPE